MASGSHLGGGLGGDGRGGGLGGMGGAGDSTGGFSFFSRPHPLLPPAATLMIPKDEFGLGMSGDDEEEGLAYLPRFCPRPAPAHVPQRSTILDVPPPTCCSAELQAGLQSPQQTLEALRTKPTRHPVRRAGSCWRRHRTRRLREARLCSRPPPPRTTSASSLRRFLSCQCFSSLLYDSRAWS